MSPAPDGYRHVIGKFVHTSAVLLWMMFAGESAAIGVTPNHPIWSVERQAFIPAEEFEPGDHVQTEHGTVELLWVTEDNTPHVVYNLEVHRDHVYRVGAGGVLVHNKNDYVDLTTPGRRTHILDGEISPSGRQGGGHGKGRNTPGKSEFPWDDDKTIHAISDVATDPNAIRTIQPHGRIQVDGTRDGVDIRVILDPFDGKIITAFPTNIGRNP